MTRGSDREDLEIIPIDQDAPDRGGPPARIVHWRHVGLGAAVIAIVSLVVLAVVGLVGGRNRSKLAPRGASPAQINGRLSLQTSQAIVVFGDKVIARPLEDQNGTGPLGLIRLAPPHSAAAPVLTVRDGIVLIHGTDLSGDGRSGTWAYPASGDRRSTFLGTSDEFVPSLDGRLAWLTAGSTVRSVSVSDGRTAEGPFPLEGHLVASVGSGLLLQRGAEVVSWDPGTPGASRTIGTGRALAGLGAYVLWQAAADGRLTITDSYTGQVRVTAVRILPEDHLSAAAVSESLFRVAAAVGTTLVIGDATIHGHAIRVHLGPIAALAWLDDNTVVAQVGARGLVAVDASGGTTVHEPDFAFDVAAFGILHPNT